MHRFLRTTLCAVAIAAGAPSAWADSQPQSVRQANQASSDLNAPLGRPAAATGIAYDSAFKRYRPYKDEEVRSWQEVNDEVGRIGGWQAYAREAAKSQATNTAPNGTHAEPHAGH